MKIYQALINKKAEISFRKDLYQSGSIKNLGSRLKEEKVHQNNSKKAFSYLKKGGVSFSCYLDLGAGSCLRSLVLENDFNGAGLAGDLSFDALKFTRVLAKDLKYKKIPLRAVIDIYHLPLKDDSLPFVMIFQTLHHLPNPKPVLKEIKRVLGNNGYLYIGEEPIKQTFNLNLWRRGKKRTWWEKILMSIGILPFITTIGKEEVESGILEESFPLKKWQSWLLIFPKVQAEIIPFKIGPQSTNLRNPSLATRFFLFLLGGGINALCQAKKKKAPLASKSILDVLACPDCPSHPFLKFNSKKKYYFCPLCRGIYPTKEGIFFLLPKRLHKQLYDHLGKNSFKIL